MKKIIIIVAVILAIIYILTTLNRIFVIEPRNRTMAKSIKAELVRDDYVQCKLDAAKNYDHMWESSCMDLGEGTSCLLAPDTANTYNGILEKANDNCLEIYKLELGAIK